jgi:hypothetical protein
MSKTLVVAKHVGGPLPNGADGCYTRWPHGLCSGVKIAKWLNELGGDEEPYASHPSSRTSGHVITNGDIRKLWLNSCDHIKQLDAVQASFVIEIQGSRPCADQGQEIGLNKTPAVAA